MLPAVNPRWEDAAVAIRFEKADAEFSAGRMMPSCASDDEDEMLPALPPDESSSNTAKGFGSPGTATVPAPPPIDESALEIVAGALSIIHFVRLGLRFDASPRLRSHLACVSLNAIAASISVCTLQSKAVATSRTVSQSRARRWNES
jgi:hypothetical protein